MGGALAVLWEVRGSLEGGGASPRLVSSGGRACAGGSGGRGCSEMRFGSIEGAGRGVLQLGSIGRPVWGRQRSSGR